MVRIGLSRYVAAVTEPPVVIVGAGLTGLSAAHHIRDRPVLLVEREHRVGGKARSHRQRGFTFDVTGHWLHLRHAATQVLLDELFAPGDLVEIERRTGVYTHGVMVPYPFQANLHGLPREVVQECLVGFVRAREDAGRADAPRPRTFQDYAVARFGAGIARHFFVPYNRKLWGVHPDQLTSEWVSRYVPEPDIEQVVAGALGTPQHGLGYNVRFLYPKSGGIDGLPRAFERALRTRSDVSFELGTSLESIDLQRRVVKLADSAPRTFGALVSTLPLPELVAKIVGAPAEVREAAAALRSVSWRYLDIATSTPAPIDEHWVYVPDPALPFFRVGIYSNALAAMAPPGCSALYVELADRDGPLDLPEILAGLSRMGAIRHADDVLFVEEHTVPHAYVLFDDAWEESTRIIFSWLDGHGIVRSCGRYGGWIYNSMEDCMLQGMEAARWVQG